MGDKEREREREREREMKGVIERKDIVDLKGVRKCQQKDRRERLCVWGVCVCVCVCVLLRASSRHETRRGGHAEFRIFIVIIIYLLMILQVYIVI